MPASRMHPITRGARTQNLSRTVLRSAVCGLGLPVPAHWPDRRLGLLLRSTPRVSPARLVNSQQPKSQRTDLLLDNQAP